MDEKRINELDALMARMNELNAMLKDVKAEVEVRQNELMAQMKENGDKVFNSERFSYTLVDAFMKKVVDTAKLKEAGLYEEYSKDSFVKESLRVKEISA